ncbi:H-X9-DG-CTERM domain-containing protein [Planctomicrobium sp. SH661]|uniref:H-X9-DG-CTERM domain-containing protein n=1 Tax=Planctomicrobium sp. SH661 TaxID=3448124 RepID=UPI003F5B1093
MQPDRTWTLARRGQAEHSSAAPESRTGPETAVATPTRSLRYNLSSRDATLPNAAGEMHCNTQLLSPHTGGLHILLCDGSVRFLSTNANLDTAKQLAMRADGQVLGEF